MALELGANGTTLGLAYDERKSRYAVGHRRRRNESPTNRQTREHEIRAYTLARASARAMGSSRRGPKIGEAPSRGRRILCDACDAIRERSGGNGNNVLSIRDLLLIHLARICKCDLYFENKKKRSSLILEIVLIKVRYK